MNSIDSNDKALDSEYDGNGDVDDNNDPSDILTQSNQHKPCLPGQLVLSGTTRISDAAYPWEKSQQLGQR